MTPFANQRLGATKAKQTIRFINLIMHNMDRIDRMIKIIDEYLESSNQREIEPDEANDVLEKEGLLNNSDERPGLPLRKLLRAGKFPHAYQIPPKKNGRWYIPHS